MLSSALNLTVKSCAILQSNYIPWKGYFDLIASVDEFILYDDMQYTRRDWRNRNLIKTRDGLKWLTIPVEVKGKYFQKIKDTKICDPKWNLTHWATIIANYSSAKSFKIYKTFFEDLYLGCNTTFLSEINYRFIKAICGLMGIKTRITWSMDYGIIDGKTERLLDLCQKSGASIYWSGPAAKAYIDYELFSDAGVQIKFIDYADYPVYPQLFPPFEHGVSVVDLVFNTGPDCKNYLKYL